MEPGSIYSAGTNGQSWSYVKDGGLPPPEIVSGLRPTLDDALNLVVEGYQAAMTGTTTMRLLILGRIEASILSLLAANIDAYAFAG